jgi:hypothetical protein
MEYPRRVPPSRPKKAPTMITGHLFPIASEIIAYVKAQTISIAYPPDGMTLTFATE